MSRGPTANELQPPKRIQAGLLYAEHLEEMFGVDAAKKGVYLEIINAAGGTVALDPAGKERRKMIMLKFLEPGGTKPLERRLGLNQTNKKALIAAFDSEYVSEWVGWIRLRVVLVQDNLKGGMVPAIRVDNRRPDMKPTFDYAANVRKRQAAHAGSSTTAAPPKPESSDLTDQVEQFTAEPEEDQSS
jgi:hypothetical protein